MKKNKMMRIAAVLLIVTLLSTCAISGTFAKYITTGEGAGSARVAKWGIEITMQDNLFKSKYATDDPDYAATEHGQYSVVAADLADVVAPGTKNADAIKATIKGTPEVATRLYLDVDVEKDIVLEAGDYLDYTTGLDAADTFNLPADYYPVKFDINFKGTIANHRNMNFNLSDIADFAGLTVADGGVSLTELKDFIDGHPGEYYEVSGQTNSFALGFDDKGRIFVDVPAGKTIDGTFTLSWNWKYMQNDADKTADYDAMDNSYVYDKADTFLGMENPAQELDFTFKAAAVQID